MKPASPHREGVIWGSCFALCAAGFSLLVATGAAQAIIDLYIRLYKIAPPYQLGDFRFTTAMALILASTVAGFLGGLTRAIIWNLHVRRTTVGSETGDGQIASGSSPSTVVLVVYATREGRTRLIAEHVAARIQKAGFAADTVDAAEVPPRFSLDRYCATIVAASVHCGGHEREIVAFVRSHAKELNRMSTAFLSVSLSEASSEDPKATVKQRNKAAADVKEMIDAFVNSTHWQPGQILPVAGAVLFTKYNFLLRLIMKRISRQAGAGTDTSRDYEYTDWKTLGDFVDEFTHSLPRSGVLNREAASGLRMSSSKPA